MLILRENQANRANKCWINTTLGKPLDKLANEKGLIFKWLENTARVQLFTKTRENGR